MNDIEMLWMHALAARLRAGCSTDVAVAGADLAVASFKERFRK